MLATLTALMLSAALPGAEHTMRIDHPTGAVEARYRSTVALSHKQVGMPAPPGRPSTLRCQWSADVTVAREARHGSGALLSRDTAHDKVLSGSRPGWCEAQQRAIAAEVATRTDAVRAHLVATAEADRPALHAELDRAGRPAG